MSYILFVLFLALVVLKVSGLLFVTWFVVFIPLIVAAVLWLIGVFFALAMFSWFFSIFARR